MSSTCPLWVASWLAMFVSLPAVPARAQQNPEAAAPEAAPPAPAPAASPAETPPPVEPPPPAPAPAAGFVGVRGTVTDDTGETLATALVQVVDGGSGWAEAGVDGSFELALPPGTYELEVSFPMFETRRVMVTVAPGQVAQVAVVLPLAEQAAEVIEIVGTIDRGSEAAQLQIRKSAAVVSDTLSAQEISRTPDSSASDAVKRVPSVTLEGGKYIVIRGLGGRYVSVLLNGVTLPSPEPDRQAVPLDLFPTALLSNLTVVKSYAAELPGIFGGGALRIDTSAYPVDFEAKLKVSTSSDTVSSFQRVNGQPGGSLDFFGYDDGTRSLPDVIPADMPVDMMSDAERERAGEAFANNWEIRERTALPSVGFGAEVGDTLELAGKRLGYLGAVSFGRKVRAVESFTSKTRIASEELGYRETLTGVLGMEEASLSVLGNLGYELGPGHSINAIAVYTHDGESVSSLVSGYNENDGAQVEQTRLQFVERSLTFAQVTGSHRLADSVELGWQGNASFSARAEPDTRDITYNVLADGRRVYKNQPGSGERFFAALDQTSLGGGLDVTAPLSRLTLRAGLTAQHTERAFLGRRFRYRYDTVQGTPAVRELGPRELFTAEHIGPTSDGSHSLYLVESTLESDGYDASLDVLGAYASADIPVADSLRLIAGARFERSDQELRSGNPTAMAGDVESVDRADPAVLPTANLVYALSDQMSLRAAYSYTLARPQFRELAPFLYYDAIERVTREGNPDLRMTRIHNAGLRWEWFPGTREVFAASAFYKRFVDPIEQVIYNAAGSRTFDNAPGADALGAEIEARTSLGRLAPALDQVHIGANLALIRSSVELGPMQQGVLTSRERPLQGQAPYVVNVNATYANPEIAELTVLYNVIGASISDVASQGLPDVYVQPFHKLDLVVRRQLGSELELKLTASNLLDDAVERRQGDLPILRYKPGMSFSLGLEWAP